MKWIKQRSEGTISVGYSKSCSGKYKKRKSRVFTLQRLRVTLGSQTVASPVLIPYYDAT